MYIQSEACVLYALDVLYVHSILWHHKHISQAMVISTYHLYSLLYTCKHIALYIVSAWVHILAVGIQFI